MVFGICSISAMSCNLSPFPFAAGLIQMCHRPVWTPLGTPPSRAKNSICGGCVRRCGGVRKALSYCSLYIATVWCCAEKGRPFEDSLGVGFSGSQMLQGFGQTWGRPCQNKRCAKGKGFTEQFVNRRHRSNIHCRMTHESPVASCITIISVWQSNKQLVR